MKVMPYRNVSSTINFEPPLPVLQQEAVYKGMPRECGKTIRQLDGEHQCDIAVTLCGQSPFMFSMSDNYDSTSSDTTALTFTWPNAFSAPRGLESHETVLPALSNLLGRKAAINAYMVYDWATDPHARGAWMSFRPLSLNCQPSKCSRLTASPGDTSTYAKALQQGHGRVVMASADWAHGFSGFVDGAIEQGARAAGRVKMELAKLDHGGPLNGTFWGVTTGQDSA